jgi:hypothetical protein
VTRRPKAKPGRRKPADPYRARKEARRARGGALLPAREIREALAAGESDGDLARRHGCSISAISRIATGTVQPDAGGPIRTERPRGGEPMIARTVKLPPGLAARIDRARGDWAFSPWMVEAAEAWLVELAARRARALRSVSGTPRTPGEVSPT